MLEQYKSLDNNSFTKQNRKETKSKKGNEIQLGIGIESKIS